jgi:hypothetical protein
MAAKTLVAAIAALFTISASASAQNYKCPPCNKGQVCPTFCVPTRPTPPATRQVYPQQAYPQQAYPQFVYPPFVGLCVTDVGTCEVFRAAGSYCECKNWIGEVFSGTVQ